QGGLTRLFARRGELGALENSGRRIGSDPAAGRIERVNPPHVVAIELEVERADILFQPLEPDRLRNGDESAVKMPADDDLRRGLAMLRGDGGDRRIAEQTAPTEGTPRFRSDPPLVMKRAQAALLKPRMKLDLVHRRRDAGFANDPLEVVAIEVRDADRSDPPVLLQTDERLPAFDIKIRARARPMDQVQIEPVAAEPPHALVECAQRCV